jgi:hypothetical protein
MEEVNYGIQDTNVTIEEEVMEELNDSSFDLEIEE